MAGNGFTGALSSCRHSVLAHNRVYTTKAVRAEYIASYVQLSLRAPANYVNISRSMYVRLVQKRSVCARNLPNVGHYRGGQGRECQIAKPL